MSSHIYSSEAFEAVYTYHGTDLGATWSPQETVFRVWAPTAGRVDVNLYRGGTPEDDDLIAHIPMEAAENGTWTAKISGNMQGFYYTYLVKVAGKYAECCDPYARSTGVNGQRAMILDLDSTNPDGWETDRDPNTGINFTDAVIYELHLRDLSMDNSSGIKNKGKFLGLTETGTRSPDGIPTGLDHIKNLGITHVHLMPVYDFGSVDESQPDKPQFNWGYDPVNFNVPEGSYSTNPFDGAVRVREMKQMVKALHNNGISVIMDVVYNHVYHREDFCFNLLVPDYFSRKIGDVYSDGSGCGNDTASERSMVRKYIVDSVCYWADEYHIDGFRFDLVGLLDVDTINLVMKAVHEKHPNVVFYGEGWQMNTLVTKPCALATQSNSALTPGFAYFNDTLRDTLRGSVFRSESLGFVTGAVGIGDTLDACFRGMPHWCSAPCQTINYVSCHDNNTLLDRITMAAPKRSLRDRIRMNKLAAAFYLTAQGVPFMQAGEEMLRSKPNLTGGFIGNSYCSPDSVNSLKWGVLSDPLHANTMRYYQGLIAFRKAHPSLRMTNSYDVLSNMVPVHYSHPQVGAFKIREGSKELYLIFSASNSEEIIPLPEGKWTVYINDHQAGTTPLAVVEKFVHVPPICAVVLVKE